MPGHTMKKRKSMSKGGGRKGRKSYARGGANGAKKKKSMARVGRKKR